MDPDELAHDLIGTCNAFPIPEEVLDSDEAVTRFYDLAFICQQCGWWCSTTELNNLGPRDLCDECHEDEDRDNE